MRGLVSWCITSTALAIASYFLVTVAQAAPVANLPLTCPNAAAIGQPQNNCGGLVYQSPTDQLIVLKGTSASATWARPSSLTSSDTLAVCTLPVEPGTYSSCRDASGVRRLAFVAKSQVFPDSPSPPPPPSSGTGTRVLDLTSPVVISESGVYVIDRDWRVEALGASAPGLAIRADNVTLDMRGFELSGDGVLIVVDGSSVTVRNGRLRTLSSAVLGGGRAVLIDALRITNVGGNPAHDAVDLYGAGSVLANSFINAQGQAVFAERGVTVRNNLITSEDGERAVLAQWGTYVFDNQLTCRGDTCVTIIGHSNVVSKNTLTSTGTAIRILGPNNTILDNVVHVRTNVFVPGGGGEPVFDYLAGEVAIEVHTSRNTIRGNFVEPLSSFSLPSAGPDFVPWQVGIRFAPNSADNRYGDNLMGAQVPFDLGATVQTDLGGNEALLP
jgi:hypothetical protein